MAAAIAAVGPWDCHLSARLVLQIQEGKRCLDRGLVDRPVALERPSAVQGRCRHAPRCEPPRKADRALLRWRVDERKTCNGGTDFSVPRRQKSRSQKWPQRC